MIQSDRDSVIKHKPRQLVSSLKVSPSTGCCGQRKKLKSGASTCAIPPRLLDLSNSDAEQVEWEGYLYKQRQIVKVWHPRYVTLSGNAIVSVYKTKDDACTKDPKRTRGVWQLLLLLTGEPESTSGTGGKVYGTNGTHGTVPCGTNGHRLHYDVNGFGFEATNGDRVLFIGTSVLDKALWLQMMQQSLLQAQTKRQQLQSMMPGDSHSTITNVNDDAGTGTDATVPRVDWQLATTQWTLANSMFINKQLAKSFLYELLVLLRATNSQDHLNRSVAQRLPLFLRHFAKDCEFRFDLETRERTTKRPDTIIHAFKGCYQAREGFVHFMALYGTRFHLTPDPEEPDGANTDNHNDPVRHASQDQDHHSFWCHHHQLHNTVTGSWTTGQLRVQLVFSPARRVARCDLSFRSAEPDSRRTKRVVVQPAALVDHAPCFHEAFLNKRSLALSFSDFDVLGVLGQGGFGTVVLVQHHQTHDEQYAIKIIDKQCNGAADSAIQERRILSGVRHPFLATLRFAFQTSTKLYLGLDFYRGGNLYLHMHSHASNGNPQLCTSGGQRFSLDRARFYAAELALALAYVHSCGIIYRDLKPDNIMLDKTGHIRLIDFGIAKQFQIQPENADCTRSTGTLAGSPAYIAPEQLATQKPQYGMSADWWSYGVLLYEMLTGTTPFYDANVAQMYKKIQTAEVRYERLHPPMDPDAVALLKQLLVRDPDKRIRFDQFKQHQFFQIIDWLQLLEKKIPPPFVPSVDDVMETVHAQFKDLTLGGHQRIHHRHKSSRDDDEFGGFDDFRFYHEAIRDIDLSLEDSTEMADDGWLVRRLQEGTMLRSHHLFTRAGEDEEEEDSSAGLVNDKQEDHDDHEDEQAGTRTSSEYSVNASEISDDSIECC